MDPQISRRERKLHLFYEQPQRINSATQVCPTTAPNGSTLIVYGHVRGLRLLWRGGRRPKEPAAASPPNGTSSHDIITIDDDDDEPAQDTAVQYEDEEDELDPDCPYPNIIQELDIDLGAAVVDLAIPALPSLPHTPRLLKSKALAVVTCVDGSTSVIALPLAPPSNASKVTFRPVIVPLLNSLACAGQYIAAKIMNVDEDESGLTKQREDGEYVYATILVAVVSEAVSFLRLEITETQVAPEQDAEVASWPLPASATGVSFHPSPRHSTILVNDASGAVRIFDPVAAVPFQRRPSSRDSAATDQPADASIGRWIMVYHATYFGAKSGMTRRKHILATRWMLGGRAILALFEDGEWGMWDVAGSVHNGRNIDKFVLNGFLRSSTPSESSSLSQQKKGGSKLVPMTPNTRRTKAENLFSGPAKVAGVASQGGISVATSFIRGPQLDESVLMWFDNEIYSITSLLTFWQRSSNSSGVGSLHSPGLTQIKDFNLLNESITSISQLPVKSSSANFGQMNLQRDFIVSTEHRMIITENMLPPTSGRNLFQQPSEQPAPRKRDLEMLDAGDLDIGGMDRLLDSMANADARPRKVGFAH